jgi:hypothetical protein
MDKNTTQRLALLRAYLRLLSEAGLLKPEDATCVLFARVDDDRLALVASEFCDHDLRSDEG